MVHKRQILARKKFKEEHPELFPKPEPTPPKDPNKKKKKSKFKKKKSDSMADPNKPKSSTHKKHPLRVPGMKPGESCFICKAQDHIAKHCPEKAQWERNKICLFCRQRGHSLKNCSNKNDKTMDKKLCYNCGESGHSLAECTRPRQDEPVMEKYYNQMEAGSFRNVVATIGNIGSTPPNVGSASPTIGSASPTVGSTPPNVPSNLELPFDPGLRKCIYSYDANVRDVIRQSYLQKGPCQPKDHDFPWTDFGSEKHRFISSWFNDYSNWLEYSIAKDAAFCLYCYLFQPVSGSQGGVDPFVGEGFKNWREKGNLDKHVGDRNSVHNICMRSCKVLMKQQDIEVCLSNHSCEVARVNFRTCLIASIDCIRFLLQQGLAFYVRDESEELVNQGDFFELLRFLAEHNKEVNQVVSKIGLENLKFASPSIQTDIVNAIAIETANAITREVGNDLFSILVDEVVDISGHEKMTVSLRFVDSKGFVVERFIGIVHVSDTNALSLKTAIEALLSRHGLSISSLRGQSYNGASNMQGEFDSLKNLIMLENHSAFYVHCFAHQLQLTVVAVAENNTKISTFFEIVSMLSNIVGALSKPRDCLQEKQFEMVIQGIRGGEILSGSPNQETTVQWSGDRCWGSHYVTLMSLADLFSSVIDLLLVIGEEGTLAKERARADMLLELIQCFEFAFILHLMKAVLGITKSLSEALEKKDQDIVNAMTLVKVTKQQLQRMRDDGWESFLNLVSLFCIKHKITIPNMEDLFVVQGRSRRNPQDNTNLHYYCVELYYAVIDLQIQELNSRFDEVNMELLLCAACLDPSNSFSKFDKTRLLRFAEFYPSEFSMLELAALEYQLDNFVMDMRSNDQFSEVMGVCELAQKMVKLRKNGTYSLVYSLVKLALLLPVAPANVERAFSATNIVKTQLRNQLGDDLMNDCLVTFIEKDIVEAINNEDIIRRFESMSVLK